MTAPFRFWPIREAGAAMADALIVDDLNLPWLEGQRQAEIRVFRYLSDGGECLLGAIIHLQALHFGTLANQTR